MGFGLAGEHLVEQQLCQSILLDRRQGSADRRAVVYDYSQPINVDAAPPNPSAADSSEQVFSAARDSFKAGDYQRALELIDQVIKETPNAPVAHEFRALCLFALKRFDEAATVAYAVLSAGPCWNWSTLVGLYPDVDTYTNQLRAWKRQSEPTVVRHRRGFSLPTIIWFRAITMRREPSLPMSSSLSPRTSSRHRLPRR